VFFILEERLIGADHFGVFMQALADAFAKTDDAFNTLGWHEGIAQDLFGFLPDTIHTACTLNETDNGPRHVEVDDNGGILQILPFA